MKKNLGTIETMNGKVLDAMYLLKEMTSDDRVIQNLANAVIGYIQKSNAALEQVANELQK